MKLAVFVTICLTILQQCTVGSVTCKAADEYRLRKDLAAGYDDIQRRMVPCHRDADVPLELRIGLSVQNIVDLNEETGVITVLAWRKTSWTDVNLAWSPEAYGGVDQLRMPRDMMWRPDLKLYNSLDVHGEEDPDVQAVVFSTGTVLEVPPAKYSVKCGAYTPTDDDDDVAADWSCRLTFGSWTYNGLIVSLDFFDDLASIDLTSYVVTEKWAVVSTSAEINVRYFPCCTEPYPEITFVMNIKQS